MSGSCTGHEDEVEDGKPLVRPTIRKELHEEGRDQAIDDEDLAPLFPLRISGPPQATSYGRIRTALIRVLVVANPVCMTWLSYWRLVAGHRPQLRIPQTAPEVGHAAMVRRIARLRLGLTAHDVVVAVVHTPSGELG